MHPSVRASPPRRYAAASQDPSMVWQAIIDDMVICKNPAEHTINTSAMVMRHLRTEYAVTSVFLNRRKHLRRNL